MSRALWTKDAYYHCDLGLDGGSKKSSPRCVSDRHDMGMGPPSRDSGPERPTARVRFTALACALLRKTTACRYNSARPLRA